MACWAPLVPFAKANVGASDGMLGLLLLCLGLGSITAMPVTGGLAARIGSRPMILAGGAGLVLFLPLLVLATNPIMLGLTLLLFGASLGTIDVAMNVHAVEVERDSDVPLMSGFHAMFSIGGFAGAGGMTLLMSLGLGPQGAALSGAALTALCLFFAAPRLLVTRAEDSAPFALPRGIVLLLAALAAVTFLVEGAILDWSALLVTARDLVGEEQGGLGYMLFAVAMTCGRLTGDRIVAALGALRVMIAGGLVTMTGLALILIAPGAWIAMSGFVLVGLGASNIVPVLFSAAGRQTVMPAPLAVAAVTTIGYAGILAGPSLIGFTAQLTSLTTAFWLLVVLIALVPLAAVRISRI